MASRSIIDGFAFSDDADVSLASSEIEKNYVHVTVLKRCMDIFYDV